jgi:type I restriction enzyme, S subunit
MFDAAEGDWKTGTLGQFLDRAAGGGTPSRDNPTFWGGCIPWVSVKDVTKAGALPQETITSEGLANSSSRLISAHTNIVATRMAVGSVVRYGVDVAINQDLLALMPSGQLDPDFLYHWLNWNKEEFLAVATGTTVKGIRKDVLLSFSIDLPPLDEQRRIAEVLRSVDEAIRCSDKAEEQAFRVLVQSLSDALRLDDLDDGRQLPGWKVARIGDLGKVQAGRQRAPNFTKGYLRPYLRVANVYDGYIDTSDVLEMMFSEREYAEYKLVPGDILLNEGQSIGLVGRAAMYLGKPKDCCFQNTLVRLRATTVLPDFAYALVRTLFWSGRLSAIATQTTSVAHLGVARFADLKVPVPPPEEQRRIAQLFNDLCSGSDGCRKAGQSLRHLKPRLKSDLLSGRVRVPA